MPEYPGKGAALHRQRETLEGIGFQMAHVEVTKDGEVLNIAGRARANQQDITYSHTVRDPHDARIVMGHERQVRAEIARRYATCVMGPPSEEELASFVGSDAPTGSPGGARQAVLPGQHRDDEAAARDDESRASALGPAVLTLRPTAGGLNFTIDFNGAEFDEDNLAHRTAIEVVGMLHRLGSLERLTLTGQQATEEVTL